MMIKSVPVKVLADRARAENGSPGIKCTLTPSCFNARCASFSLMPGDSGCRDSNMSIPVYLMSSDGENLCGPASVHLVREGPVLRPLVVAAGHPADAHDDELAQAMLEFGMEEQGEE